VKKLISIGVALALLAMVVVPGAVAAQDEPDTYAKIPFGILSTGIQLVADIWPSLDSALGINMPWVATVMAAVGNWTGGPLAWLTELSGWSMLAIGDVASVGLDVASAFAALPAGIDQLPKMLYVVANRVFDAWGTIPTGNMTDQLPPALGLG
jgi:hypothetical protein